MNAGFSGTSAALSHPTISLYLPESDIEMSQGQGYAQGRAHAPSKVTGELDLVRRALARDETAVRAIMKANNRRLYRLACGILRNDAEAEDVVQETYVRAFTRLNEFRSESSLSTWLSRDRDERSARPAAAAASRRRFLVAARS
jgi:Sigma-70 region 2